MRFGPDSGVIIAALLLPGLLACAVAEHVSDGWAWYTTQRAEHRFRVAYPTDWTIAEDRVATTFRPPGDEATARITVLVIDVAKTPPPPVMVTYDTVRIIQGEGRSIAVEQRDPSAANERYLVRLRHGPLTTEFRFTGTASDETNSDYKGVFDHMVLSYILIPQS